MRWVVFFLFVLNGLVFVWFSFQEDRKAQINDVQQEEFDFSGTPAIVLLSELPEADLRQRDIRSVASSEVTPSDGTVCALVGPFLEIISAKQARNRLEERQLFSKVVLVLKELPAVNWVYIAPRDNRKQALELLKELQSKNIDSFLIADGEYENGISLGFFSNSDSANAVLAEYLKQGYPVSLAQKKREQKTYWLTFDQQASAALDELSIAKLEEGNFAVKKQEKSCGEIALFQIIE